jgi:hypothetical protein
VGRGFTVVAVHSGQGGYWSWPAASITGSPGTRDPQLAQIRMASLSIPRNCVLCPSIPSIPQMPMLVKHLGTADLLYT